jgi:hypothetical protein
MKGADFSREDLHPFVSQSVVVSLKIRFVTQPGWLAKNVTVQPKPAEGSLHL